MGGRSIEVLELETDCVITLQGNGGSPDQHFINGKLRKHRGRNGERANWSVHELAVEAVRVLKQVSTPWRTRRGSTRLFITQTGARMNHGFIPLDLKNFLERIGAPYVGGKPFPISSHMFRVALAQWLAAEPYGEIAGAFHLKHLSTAAFRGYLRDDPQFRSLFESFEIQASEDHLGIVLQEPKLQGKFGASVMLARSPERQAELEANVRVIDRANVGREAPSTRTIQKLKKSGVPVYYTPYCMCMFKAETAECLKGAPEAERSRPAAHRCSPLKCANAALTRLQVPAYLDDMEAYAELRDDKLSSPSQRELARKEIQVLWPVVQPHIVTLKAEHRLLEDELSGLAANEASTIAKRSRRDAVAAILGRLEAGRFSEECGV
jgi:hypothetical protein